MDKQTAICLLPESPAPTPLVRNESLCQKTTMIPGQDLSASECRNWAYQMTVTRIKGPTWRKGRFL